VLAASADVELIAYPASMGEEEAREAGLAPSVIGLVGTETTAADTRAAVTAMAEEGVDLLLFAGGDGTAVDVLEAVGGRVPALGIPAGVKMHSAVFAVNPRSAGRLALLVAEGRVHTTVEAEVADVDEDALREGVVSPRLYGYLRVPVEAGLVQGGKARTAASDRAAQQAIAAHVVDRLPHDRLWFVGPGTTTRAILEAVGAEKTVLGVDVVRERELVVADADEETLLRLASSEAASVIVTPVGGQGFVFGRGNQQLSARVLREVGRENVVVVATEAKLAALAGRPLLVDTGDAGLDRELAGYVRVVTGYDREVVYRVSDGEAG
jgi:predicted polyphosphate/ATP-dependent NAD kinase